MATTWAPLYSLHSNAHATTHNPSALSRKIPPSIILEIDGQVKVVLQFSSVYGVEMSLGLPATSMKLSATAVLSTGQQCFDLSKGVKHLVDTSPNLVTIPSEFVLPPALRPSLALIGASIPSIDLHGLDGPLECREMVVRQIGSACAEWGFFRIVNHGIEEKLMKEMMKVVKAFFDLPWEQKAIHASDDVMCSVRYGTSLNTPAPHVRHWRDYLRHHGHPVHKNFHLWPKTPPNYRQVAKEYLQEVWKLVLELAGAISESLCLERNYVHKSLGEGCQIVAANYYPACPEPDLALGLAAHSDHGGITVLMQNEVDGLQVRHGDRWILVPHVPGTFVVNVGDYLEILSNGKYKSVEHRAVVNQERTRISVGVGHGPELSATMAPAAPLVEKSSQAKYKSMTYADYMNLQQTTALRGKTALEVLKILDKSS